MLERLTVANLAVIEKAEAVFSEGLNVLTGETGAGKSVLMRALEMSLGMRTAGAAVRDGKDSARIEAVFSLSPAEAAEVKAVLDPAGIDDGGDALVVRRTVSSNGSSRAWINDCHATSATLKRLGSVLVDFHGPRSNQDVLSPKYQLSILDAYGSTDMKGYVSAWEDAESARREMEELSRKSLSADEAEFIRYQVSELEEAELSPDDEDLASRHAAAAHVEEICSLAGEAEESLGGDSGASASLAAAGARFASMAKHLPEAEAWRSEAEEISARVEELSRSVADAVSRLDLDPDEFERMDARLGVLNRLKRKTLGPGGGAGVSGLLALLEEKKKRLSEFDSRAERTAALEAALRAAEERARKEAARLTASRKKSSKAFSAAVTGALRDLGFAKASFSVRILPAELSATGADAAEFMFEPNPGQAARPLRDIASSGEIARVMLAIKGVIASWNGASTLVFDEIDANIGGETGRAVGRRMRELSRGRQIIAITHLPQSAVCADCHLVVSKRIDGATVRTEVKRVTGDERVLEITRMLGGGGSRVAKAHAVELIDKEGR